MIEKDSDTTAGDNEALIAYVAEAERHRLTPIEAGTLYAFVDSGGTARLLDTEALGDEPRRPKGTVRAHSGDGFVDNLQRRLQDIEPYGLYANVDDLLMTAILNDDTQDSPGWRDYRIDLALRPTPEWMHWKDHQGLKSLAQFAEIIEEGLPEISRPAPAVMLELAQTFEANVTAKFKQGAQLSDGRRQFVFEEQIDARAGNAGTVEIPDTFELTVAPFFGTTPQVVTCRLRRRLREGALTIGYEIVRAHEVERAAFDEVRSTIEEKLGRPATEGVAPAAR